MKFVFNKEWQDHAAPIYALDIDNANNIYTGGADKIVAKWSVNSDGNLPFHIKTDFGIYHLSHSKNELLFIGQSKGGVHVIDKVNKKEVAYLLGHTKGVYKTIIHDKENMIFCLGGDGICSVWDLLSFKHIKNIPISSGKLRDGIIQEKVLWIACGNGNMSAVHLPTLSILKQIPVSQDALYTIAKHPLNTDLMFCGGKDALLYILNTKNNTSFHFPAHNFAVYKLVILPELHVIASASRDKTIKLWNIADFSFRQKLERTNKQGHTASINNLAYLPNTKQLISVGDDKRIICWQGS